MSYNTKQQTQMRIHHITMTCTINGRPQQVCPFLNLGTWEFNLTGKRIFVDNLVKDSKMRSSWTMQVGPKSNDKCSYKSYPEERHRQEGHVKTEAETGVMLS